MILMAETAIAAMDTATVLATGEACKYLAPSEELRNLPHAHP